MRRNQTTVRQNKCNVSNLRESRFEIKNFHFCNLSKVNYNSNKTSSISIDLAFDRVGFIRSKDEVSLGLHIFLALSFSGCLDSETGGDDKIQSTDSAFDRKQRVKELSCKLRL